MNSIILHPNNNFNYAEINLPSSKSLSNRALIIRELTSIHYKINCLSSSDDTKNLIASLASLNNEINVGAAGTNMRFLISLLAIRPGQFILTGNDRIQKRPVGELVDCLRYLGAEIRYLKNEGFPPLEIIGKNLDGGKISIDGSISSQFISSLLMIAPCLKQGLEIEILHQVVSWPYIDMTLSLMNYFGIQFEKDNNKIKVSPQEYKPRNYNVEQDWSSASFWFGLVANSKIGTKILLKNLLDKGINYYRSPSQHSLQGDRMAVEYFKLLGVQTKDTQTGTLIEKIASNANNLHFHLINEPDLFPVLAFSCAALGIKASFTGLQTLNLKESNRIQAINTELEKTGTICQSGTDYFEIKGYNARPNKIVFDTYGDHRLAMSASIFLGSYEKITINDPEVVSKSYPEYWDDLKNIGYFL